MLLNGFLTTVRGFLPWEDMPELSSHIWWRRRKALCGLREPWAEDWGPGVALLSFRPLYHPRDLGS